MAWKQVIGKLNAATMDALADPALRARLNELGYEFRANDRLQRSSARW
jgi:hypothetical protein